MESIYLDEHNHVVIPEDLRVKIQDNLIQQIYPLLGGYTMRDIETSFDRIKSMLRSYQAIGKVHQVSSQFLQA